MLSPLLASCRLDEGKAAAGPRDWDAWWRQQQRAGVLDFANWPYYIDRRRDGSHPSLEAFTKETGILVNYSRPIRDDMRFLNKIRPALAAGRPTGYDIIVMTNGPQLSALIEHDWLIPLDHAYLTSFEKNASDLVRDPPWDRGNRFTVAWQSGMTGIGYRPEAEEALGHRPRSVGDLWDPALAGRVGMLVDEMDLGSFGLLAVGADPETSTEFDWSRAAAALRQQRQSGVVRGYYDQGYLQALERGDIWISQAWSGDIFQANQLGHPELRFVVPEEGAILWTDSMMIPAGAQHPVDAMVYMDSVYRRLAAATIADWVWYVSPVPAARGVIEKRFRDPTVAESPLVFPPASTLGSVEPTTGAVSSTGDAGSSAAADSSSWSLWAYPTLRSADDLAAWRRFFGDLPVPAIA